MNNLQVLVTRMQNTRIQVVRKLDKLATTVIQDTENHVNPDVMYNETTTSCTVFHSNGIAYQIVCKGIPTRKQFKQLALKAYNDWLNKQNSAV